MNDAATKALTVTVVYASDGKTILHTFKIDPTKKTIVRPEHSLFGYVFEPEVVEYGRIHTDGSRSGGQPVVDNAMLDALQKDAGLPHLPTQETYQFRMAVSGEGPLAYQWSDKPHRLLYDACSIIEREAALRTYSNVVAAGSDRIGGAGVVPHGVVGVAAQREITQADIDAAESIFWVETIIDDHEAVAKAFARHHQHGYDQGYYDGQRDRPPTQSDALLDGDAQTITYLLGVRHGREDERAKIAAEASQPTQSDALRDQLLQECLVKLRDAQGKEAPKQYACNLIKRIERVLQGQSK